MSISRLLYWHTASKRNGSKEIAKQRSKAIKRRWPKIPLSPKTLRDVRNSLEHFEERMDEWAVSDSSHIFIDNNIGSGRNTINIDGKEPDKSFRGTTRMDILLC